MRSITQQEKKTSIELARRITGITLEYERLPGMAQRKRMQWLADVSRSLRELALDVIRGETGAGSEEKSRPRNAGKGNVENGWGEVLWIVCYGIG